MIPREGESFASEGNTEKDVHLWCNTRLTRINEHSKATACGQLHSGLESRRTLIASPGFDSPVYR